MTPSLLSSLRGAAALAAVLFVAPLPAQVIDQQQTNSSVCMSGLWSVDLAQSFTPAGVNSVGGGFKMSANGANSESVSIELWDALPNAGGTLLGSGTATASSGQWVDVFWPLVSVTPGNTYYLVIHGTANGLCVGGTSSDLYPGGFVYTNPGFDPFPNFDYAFRTFTDTSPLLSLIDVQPGSFMTFDIQSIGQGSTVVTLVSTAGPGPTSTPFGPVQVSQPWMQTPAFPPNAVGTVNFTTTMPASLSGLTLYIQAVELEGGGVGELSNALAIAVP